MTVKSGLLCVQCSKLYLNQFYVMSVESSSYVQYSTLYLNSLHALLCRTVSKAYMYIILNILYLFLSEKLEQEMPQGYQLMVCKARKSGAGDWVHRLDDEDIGDTNIQSNCAFPNCLFDGTVQ